MVRPVRHPFLDHPGVLAIAHRGGADAGDENTLAAFERAVALGFPAIETDVRVTRDGVALAFHDERLDRVSDRTGAIAELSYAELAAVRVRGQPIPRLDDVLGSFRVRVNLDPKDDAAVDAIARAVERTATFDRVCVGSFSTARLRRLRRRFGPRLCTSLGPREGARLFVSARLRLPGGFAGQCVQMPPAFGGVPLVDRRLIETAHRRGLAVHVWTVDDPAEMERLIDVGVDGIMTDRPAVLRSVLERRGLWRL